MTSANETSAFRLAAWITAINVLVASGFAIAGLVAPQAILPAGAAPSEASFVFALYAAARSLPLAARRAKNLENANWTPRLLQVVEIPQNRQRILWKNLEKKGLVLEILGQKICRLGARS